VVGDDEFKDSSSGIQHPDRVRVDYHAFAAFGHTGGGKVTPAFYFYDTDTASAGFVLDPHVAKVIIAKGRDIDSRLACGLQDGAAGRGFDDFIIYGEFDRFHDKTVYLV
jgi:hypothetical protein